jgi:hypothetical protein
MAVKNGIYQLVNEGGLANESIFAIMLQTFNELTNTNNLINGVSTITDWSRMSSPTSPYLFKEATDENINIISNLLKENPNAIFLRKVDRSFPDQAILDLFTKDHDINSNSNNNQLTKKKVYNFYYGMLFLIFIFTFTFTFTFTNCKFLQN